MKAVVGRTVYGLGQTLGLAGPPKNARAERVARQLAEHKTKPEILSKPALPTIVEPALPENEGFQGPLRPINEKLRNERIAEKASIELERAIEAGEIENPFPYVHNNKKPVLTSYERPSSKKNNPKAAAPPAARKRSTRRRRASSRTMKTRKIETRRARKSNGTR